MSELTHFNEQGRAKMVDVTEKAVTRRIAVAAGEVHMAPDTMAHIKNGTMKKGDVLAVAQVAGIQAAKHNWELIPMCHPLPLTGIDITFHLSDNPCMVEIQAAVSCTGVTGVEMEALTAISVAALTIYDMCKAVQKDMHITNIRLLRKSGGKSGDYIAEEWNMAKVVSVNISERKGTLKKPVPQIELKLRHGIVGDAHAGDWHRQISLLAEESVDTMRALSPISLDAGVFAENINTVGIDLKHLPVGTHLRIGETEVEVTQIGKECHNDCAIKKAVGKCVMPTEGIFAVVVKEGTVRPGDEIEILEAAK